MTVTENELAALADGQLSPADAARVEQAVAAEPVLAARLAAHRALQARLSGHFAPMLAEDPPERLTALLQPRPAVVNLAEERQQRAERARLPRWTWIAGPALAASLLIAIVVPGGQDAPAGYADAQLASVLDNQLAADQDPQASTRVLLSFVREGGDYCRAYASADASGIACREQGGWALVEQGAGEAPGQGQFQQAGSPLADVLARAQDMAVGEALDAAAEQSARARGWRD